jgi:hypothetical protein
LPLPEDEEAAAAEEKCDRILDFIDEKIQSLESVSPIDYYCPRCKQEFRSPSSRSQRKKNLQRHFKENEVPNYIVNQVKRGHPRLDYSPLSETINPYSEPLRDHLGLDPSSIVEEFITRKGKLRKTGKY